MNPALLAKNLLENKLCDTCIHHDLEFNGDEYCFLKVTLKSSKEIERLDSDLPEDRSCENWEQDNKEKRLRNLFNTYGKNTNKKTS